VFLRNLLIAAPALAVLAAPATAAPVRSVTATMHVTAYTGPEFKTIGVAADGHGAQATSAERVRVERTQVGERTIVTVSPAP
jgi:hypothetical protein